MAGESEFVLRARRVVTSPARTQLAAPNAQRLNIMIAQSDTTISGTINLVLPDGSLLAYQTTVGVTFQVSFLYKDWGPLPALEWVYIGGGAADALLVIELLLPMGAIPPPHDGSVNPFLHPPPPGGQ